jgi:hypothetical protein
MNESQVSKPVRIIIAKDSSICRVIPGKAIAWVQNGVRDEIVLSAINVDAWAFFPDGAIEDEDGNPLLIPVRIPKEESRIVYAGRAGVYPYAVVCQEDKSKYRSAVGDSDPVLVIGRTP